MKKLLNVMPVGAPWGGPESVRFASCFASLVMYLEHYDDSTPVFCTEDIGLCRRCGKCGAVGAKKKHEEMHHLYLTVSGLGLHTVWREDYEAKCLEDMTSIEAGDGYIERAMAYAGYSYASLDGASKEELKNAITRSIDEGFPVLACNVFGDDWSILPGYAEDGETLYARYAPKPWDSAGRLPDAAEEDGAARKSDWHAPGARILTITGKRQPDRDYAALFQSMADALRQPATKDCISGMGAYDACVAKLRDDAFFRDADGETLRKCYFYFHAFIGALAEGRCFAAFAFLQGFGGQIEKCSAADLVHMVGSYFMDTHNKCWGAWAAMGNNHICQPEVYAEAFRGKAVREKVVSYIEEFRTNDEMAALLLGDSKRIDWFKM